MSQRIISIVGRHNSGKTTVIEKLIPVFKKRNYSVAVIKHSHHIPISCQKDTERLQNAGASAAYLSDQGAIVYSLDKSLLSLLNSFSNMDLILIEGGKQWAFPKIEVVNHGLDENPLFDRLEDVRALIVDYEINATSLSQFNRNNDIELIADFIWENSQLMMPSSTPAFVLVGGQSQRMGQNKALLEFNHHTVIEEIITYLKKYFFRIVLIGKNIEPYQFLGTEILSDYFLKQCAVSGILTGLCYLDQPWGFFISCDQLFIEGALKRILNVPLQNQDCVMLGAPDKKEPLFAFYNKHCISELLKNYQQSNFSVKSIMDTLRVQYVPRLGSENINVNYPKDYQRALELLHASQN